MFKKITIIGVGLIGGSIGLVAGRKKLAGQIVGVCRHQQSLRRAKRKGAIIKGSLNYKVAVEGADLVILATPIKQIIKIGQEIAPHLKPGCLVMDVGSTKEEVVAELEKIMPKKCSFVGAHPLAGSEKKGVNQACADLFKGALCILTKSRKTESLALQKISSFWRHLGCRIKVLTPRQHDRNAALISHLPHLAAVQLVNIAGDSLLYAASGFLDTTRIASSESEIWADIFLSNKKFVIQAIDRYRASLSQVRDLIQNNDKRKLSAVFQKAKALRDALQK